MPAGLRERLGTDASRELLDMFDRSQRQTRDQVVEMCMERSERRLSEEIAGVRVQIAQTEGMLRREIAEMGAALRQETAQVGAGIRVDMAAMGASIRQEMAQMGAGIREDMAAMGASIRQEMAQMGAGIREDVARMGADVRVEMLKWSFLFWIGQVVTMTGIIGLMLRLYRA
jgi:hypothetical protein